MQCNQKFTFILDENNAPPQKNPLFCKLMNFYILFFYIVCKCLSSIIYYGLYMDKVDGFLFQS